MERPSHGIDIFSIARKNPESIAVATASAEDELLNFEKRFQASIFYFAFSDSDLAQRALTKAETELSDFRKRFADLHRPRPQSSPNKKSNKDPVDRRKLLKQLALGAAAVGVAAVVGNSLLNTRQKTNEEIAQEKYEKAKSMFLDGGFLNGFKYVLWPTDWVQEIHTLLNEAINLNPQHYDAFLVRGILYATFKPMGYGRHILENYNRSMADFDLVLERNPNSYQALNNRAVARSFFLTDPAYKKYLPGNIRSESIEDFRKSVGLAPNEIYPLGNLYGTAGLKKVGSPGQVGEDRIAIEKLYSMAGHDLYFKFKYHKFFYKSINGKDVYGW